VAESGAFSIVVERMPGLRVRGVQCWVTGQLMGRVIGRVCPLPAALRNLRSTKWSACAWPRNGKCDGRTRERTSWPLVRVADLNGELSADAFGQVTRPRRSAIDRFWTEPMSLAT
jgi:hypothetical protein